jgi:hypothetical protein
VKSDEVAAIAGVYHYTGVAAVTHFLLTLDLDGTAKLHYWRDVGGSWQLQCHGRFTVTGSLIQVGSTWPRNEWRSRYPEDLSLPLQARYLSKDLVLVADRHLAEFDQTAGVGADTEFRQFYSFRKGWQVFEKRAFPKALICMSNTVYQHALTVGKTYMAVEERVDGGLAQVRLVGDHGRTRWFPASCFRVPSALDIPRFDAPEVL